MFDLSKQQPRTIAILGGGPASAATALSLQHSLKRLSSDNQRVTEEDFQICLFNMDRSNENSEGCQVRIGESIPPAATPVLRRLGIEDIVTLDNAHLECPGSISMWNSDKPQHNDFLLDLDGLGYHLDRAKFDEQILDRAIQSGVKQHQGWRLTGVNEVEGHKHLEFKVEGNRQQSVVADFVVDATGKASVFTRHLKICRNTFDDVTFLSCFIDIPEGSSLLPHTFIEAVEQGWWYAARLPNNKMIVTLCSDRQSIKNHGWNKPREWLSLLNQTKWLSKNIPACLLQATGAELDIGIHSAPSSILSAVCGADWLAVGDAACSYDPITSAGITKALIHGEMAGKAIAGMLTHQKSDEILEYQRQVFDDFNHYVSLRAQLYQSERRFVDAGFWRRRFGR